MTEDPVYRALRTARSCLDRLERDHATVRANMAAGQQPTLTQGVATADPDGNVNWTRVDADGNTRIHLGIGRYQMLIEHALVNLLEADLMRSANVKVNTAPIAAAGRCDGGADEWADPTCERIAVTSQWWNGTQLALCDSCERRRRNAIAQQKAAST